MKHPNPVSQAIEIEAEPTPFVFSVARALRLAAQNEVLLQHFHALAATGTAISVGINGTPKKATLTFTEGSVKVRHGADRTAKGFISVDAARPYKVLGCVPEETDDDCIFAISQILNPPLAELETVAEQFWAFTSEDTGMPERLVIYSSDGRKLVYGDGPTQYEIYGQPEDIARVLAGIDPFFDSLFAGKTRVKGTTAQLSVIAGACWKVQFHG